MTLYHGLRADVSLLMEHGHREANHYPLAHVWSEARIVRTRINEKMRMESLLMQAVAISAMDSKAGTPILKQLLSRLEGNG